MTLHRRLTVEHLEDRCVPAVLSVTDAGPATFFVCTGFNDNAGINSTPAIGSPYTIGNNLNTQGASEPGWSGVWGHRRA